MFSTFCLFTTALSTELPAPSFGEFRRQEFVEVAAYGIEHHAFGVCVGQARSGPSNVEECAEKCFEEGSSYISTHPACPTQPCCLCCTGETSEELEIPPSNNAWEVFKYIVPYSLKQEGASCWGDQFGDLIVPDESFGTNVEQCARICFTQLTPYTRFAVKVTAMDPTFPWTSWTNQICLCCDDETATEQDIPASAGGSDQFSSSNLYEIITSTPAYHIQEEHMKCSGSSAWTDSIDGASWSAAISSVWTAAFESFFFMQTSGDEITIPELLCFDDDGCIADQCAQACLMEGKYTFSTVPTGYGWCYCCDGAGAYTASNNVNYLNIYAIGVDFSEYEIPAPPAYEMITSGTCGDHGLEPVNTLEECELAAEWLELDDQTASPTSIAARPEGCYYTEALWFAVDGTLGFSGGCGFSTRKPICKVA